VPLRVVNVTWTDLRELACIGEWYGIQVWGTASTSNIKILERLQSKALRMSGRTLVCVKYGYPKGSAYQIPSVILVFVILVSKV
jgi:hypothetical protein